MSTPRPANHLKDEKSPYLLQHARNPVDWYPWGEEAFEKSRREDKPVFLSIGYSTCHWCHVMERESFEDDSVAALLNEHFVPVKVDREERPDVDRVYMSASQALGTGGGWPLNVFLTPDLRPFFGGTYFPPRSMHGRIGMLDLLPRVAGAWREERDALVDQGQRVIAALAAFARRDDLDAAAPAPEAGRLIDACYRGLERVADPEHGGFGGAPKFPQPSNLAFLFHAHATDASRFPHALELALAQLDAMRASGIHDQLGGGFHRYATDARWLVPHFEKMLYDQAQIAWAYLEGYQLTGREAYADAARGIFRYVTRDLTTAGGGLDSAEDADSEGEEGRFYVWTPASLAAALDADTAALAAYRWGVTEHGNFEHGTTILTDAHTVEETAARVGRPVTEVREALERARDALLEARSRRPRPHRDDKVLAAWNGLMISAFARGARALGDPNLRERAEHAATFVWTRLWDDERGELARRWRDGERSGRGQLADYAFLAHGFLDLYRATLHRDWLERAIAITEAQEARFHDAAQGGWFESPPDDPHLPLRMKDDHDGAEISGSSIAASNLLTLGDLLDRHEWRERARRATSVYAARLEKQPLAMPMMLVALSRAARPPRHVVIAGRPDDPAAREMIRAFDARHAPDDLLLLVDPDRVPDRPGIERLAPFAAGLGMKDGRAAAYVCVDYACTLPVTSADEFRARLDAPAMSHPGESR